MIMLLKAEDSLEIRTNEILIILFLFLLFLAKDRNRNTAKQKEIAQNNIKINPQLITSNSYFQVTAFTV